MKFSNNAFITRECQEKAREWVVALRSGAYQQGKMALRTGNTFCCLGVLCDLHDPDGWSEVTLRGECRYAGETAFPPLFVMDGVLNGIVSDIPESLNDEDFSSPTAGEVLAELNDTGATFDEIADHIAVLFGLEVEGDTVSSEVA